MFLDLHATRQSGFAPNPISYLEIEAYQRTMGHRFGAWEVEAVRALDMEFLRICASKVGAKTERPEAKKRPPPPRRKR